MLSSLPSSFFRTLLCLSLLSLCYCAPTGNEETSSPENLKSPLFQPAGEEELQTLDRDIHFGQTLASLNFNASGMNLTYKAGGTSLGLGLSLQGKKIGKWLPQNSAADPEAQVVSYQLGRYLRMSENVAPSAFATLTASALRSFQQMLWDHSPENNNWREENRQFLLAELEKNPRQLRGVFSRAPETFEVTELEDLNQGSLNTKHPLARFIRADGPLPSAERRMSFKGVGSSQRKLASATELELARQLSKILILDSLLGQWDRWSGGNFEAAVSEGDRLYFIARDNGGASLASRTQDHSLTYVSRFDREQLARVKKLLLQLQNPEQSEPTLKLLKIQSSPKWLIERAKNLLAYADTQIRRYGENAFFPEEP